MALQVSGGKKLGNRVGREKHTFQIARGQGKEKTGKKLVDSSGMGREEVTIGVSSENRGGPRTFIRNSALAKGK